MPEQAHTIERAAYLRRRKRQKRWVLLAQLGLLIGFFALWEIAAQQGWIDDFIMSSPSRIWKTLKNLYASGELFRHLGAHCLEDLLFRNISRRIQMLNSNIDFICREPMSGMSCIRCRTERCL